MLGVGAVGCGGLVSFLTFFLTMLSMCKRGPFILGSNRPIAITYNGSRRRIMRATLGLLGHSMRSIFSAHVVIAPRDGGKVVVIKAVKRDGLVSGTKISLSPVGGGGRTFLLAISSGNGLIVTNDSGHNATCNIVRLSQLVNISP